MPSKQKNYDIIPVMITPFDNNGEIYEKGIENLYSYIANQGVETIFVAGSYGAFALMTIEQRIKFAKLTVKIASKLNLKVMYTVASSSLDETLYMIEKLNDLELDSYSVLAPYYYSTSGFYNFNQIKEYLRRILDKSKHPIYFYNNPKTTGINLSPSQIVELSEMGIFGVKDSAVTMDRLMEISNSDIGSQTSPLRYITGNTASMLFSKSAGFEYVMSGMFLAFPKLIEKLMVATRVSNLKKALEIYKQVIKIDEITKRYAPRSISLYYILAYKGVDVGVPKFPWPQLSQKEVDSLINDLKEIGAFVE